MKLPQLHVGFGTQCGPATFFPIWADAPATQDLDTGSEAHLVVNELATPQVSKLVVTNYGTKPALLTEGTLLEGGQQHRINTRSLLIGAGETTEIDVLCVEQGRWNGNPLHRHSGRRAPLHVQAGLHGTGTDHQSDVWRRVQRYEGLRTRSATSSLIEHLDVPPQQDAHLPNLLDGQRGVIVGFGGQVLSLELFGSAKLFRRHYAPLMESTVLDLLLYRNQTGTAPTTPVAAQAARNFVVAIASNGFSPTDRTEHRSGDGTIPAKHIEGRRPGLSTRGVSIKGTHGTEPQIAHQSAWNTRHRALAAL